jgi:hypothetical protein
MDPSAASSAGFFVSQNRHKKPSNIRDSRVAAAQ